MNMLPPIIKEHLQFAVDGANTHVTSLVQSDAGRIFTVLALVYLGFALLRLILGVINFIFVYFLRPGKNLKFYGAWAVVTGATDGIGKEYAVQLAKRGLNIVVVSRTQSKLDAVTKELQSAHGIQVRTCAVDLCRMDATAAAKVATALKDLEVGILVNNAGMSYDHCEYVEQMDASMDMDIITINTLAPTLLTKLVLPGMKQRGRGVIVNLGSANGLLPAVPLLSTYAGSKAYINQFTRSLDAETRSFGVRVHDQCPLFVATKMAKIKRARLDAPTPAVWARAAVKQIGYDTVRTPYWFHGIMLAAVQNLIPSWLVVSRVHAMHKAFRAAYYRKQARLATAAAAEAVASVGTKKSK